MEIKFGKVLIFFNFIFQDVIVDHLKRQYDKNHIYTYMGDILLAVNPFSPLTIYSDEVKIQHTV